MPIKRELWPIVALLLCYTLTNIPKQFRNSGYTKTCTCLSHGRKPDIHVSCPLVHPIYRMGWAIIR